MDLPPPPSERTPRLFMTPQIGKRKDGLCPSLHYHQSSARQVLERPGELSKVYQTNSALLLQIKKKDNIPKEIMELQTLVEAIYATLKNAVKHREGVTDLRFKPEGCIWIIEFEDETASEQFRIEIILEAQEGMGMTIYYIDSRLIPKIEIDPNPLAPSPSGFNVAKEVFDKITLFVRKSIVRFEFPEFPEGCKGRPFREVYQLNARVSILPGSGPHESTSLTYLFFHFRSSKRVRLQPCVEGRIEQPDTRLPSNVCCAKICPYPMMQPFMMKWPFFPVCITITLCK
jgi:hypothetical protein